MKWTRWRNVPLRPANFSTARFGDARNKTRYIKKNKDLLPSSHVRDPAINQLSVYDAATRAPEIERQKYQ